MIVGILTGTTASGKSAVALELAERKGWELISADSRQIYSGFRIGTGQPTAEEQRRVVHHLVDQIDPRHRFSVGEFVRAVLELERHSPEVPRIVVGGTGFYLSALIRGLPPIPEIEPHWREGLHQELAARGAAELYAELRQIDPEAALKLSLTDERRIVRALEVIRSTGKQWSWWETQREVPFGDLPMVALVPDAEKNRSAIALRVANMFEAGWAGEVEALLASGIPPEAPAFGSLGYPEIAALLRGEVDRSRCEKQISILTCQYAKRQRTFFRGQFPEVTVAEKIDAEELERTLIS